MEHKFSVEIVEQIWDDKHGDRIEVGPDRDSLGLVEIRSFTDDGKRGPCLGMRPEQALLVGEALMRAAKRQLVADDFQKKGVDDP